MYIKVYEIHMKIKEKQKQTKGPELEASTKHIFSDLSQCCFLK